MGKTLYIKMSYIPGDLDHLWVVLPDQGKQSLHCFASVNNILSKKKTLHTFKFRVTIET